MSEVEIRFNKRTGAMKLDVLDGQGPGCVNTLDELQDALGTGEVIEETEKEEISYTEVDGCVDQGCGG